eukprot:scaffold321712_cov48-Prasinocladus_malaysianus.AAC.1
MSASHMLPRHTLATCCAKETCRVKTHLDGAHELAEDDEPSSDHRELRDLGELVQGLTGLRRVLIKNRRGRHKQTSSSNHADADPVMNVEVAPQDTDRKQATPEDHCTPEHLKG